MSRDDIISFIPIKGLIKLKAYAKLQNTICLLCLPEKAKNYDGKSCTVTGYGKPSITALNNVAVEGNHLPMYKKYQRIIVL